MISKSQAKAAVDLISRFIPKSRYKKAKHSNGNQFVVASTGESYKGFYIEDSRGNFIAGKTPEERGPELQAIEPPSNITSEIVGGTKVGVVQRELTQREITQGTIKRYFTQEVHSRNILEVPLEEYIQDRQDTLRKKVVELDWRIKGPSEDGLFGKYPYQGAASRNRRTVLDLENTMPGISSYIQDYRYLVQEPQNQTNTQTGTGTQQTLAGNIPTGTEVTTTVQQSPENPLISLENSRKANFDTRK
jgi:hypothetical protein